MYNCCLALLIRRVARNFWLLFSLAGWLLFALTDVLVGPTWCQVSKVTLPELFFQRYM